MSTTKGYLSAIAIVIGGVTASLADMQTMGWVKVNGQCILVTLDGGFNCTTSGNIICTVTVNGVSASAYDTQAHCETGGTTGLLKRN